MQLKPGSLLQGGKYQIEKVLGQGGFGITYLGVQTGLNRKVAIKEFFMKDFCNRDENTSHVSVGSQGSRELVERFRQKFIKEAQTIATLENPHIISIYDIFEENGTAYYVMKHVSGGSLKEYIEARGKLPESEALKFIRQIADALAYIHEQKILHLDVKPANVLLDERTHEAILIDFGISKHYDEAGGQTSSSPAGISKGYAPLEQYNQGGVDNFLPCTDIYSLGATLYFMLTGQVPPEASIIYDDGLHSLPSFISAPTRKAIEQAMQPKRKERPQSVVAFLLLFEKEKVANCQIDEETVIPKTKKKDNEKKKDLFNKSSATVSNDTLFYKYILKKDGTYKVELSAQFKVQLNRIYGGRFTSNGYLWKTGDALPNPAPNGKYNHKMVTDMSNMFEGCDILTYLDVSSFNTANVRCMNGMFANCSSLTHLDVSSFNTANVRCMSDMFYNCSSLTSLDVSRFNTANVTNMSEMFSGCFNLTSLNVSGFKTDNVKDMNSMFCNCRSIISLDISGFNTSNVTNMNSMFFFCFSLTSLDVKGFNTFNVKSIHGMFNGCCNLKNLDMSNFNTTNVSNMCYMFNGCNSLTDLDVSGFNTTYVTDMCCMFRACSSLTSLDLRGFNTAHVNDMRWMFSDCISLIGLDLSGFITTSVSNMRCMFNECNNLITIDLSKFDVIKVTDMSEMFSGCSRLTYFDLSSFEICSSVKVSNMFSLCSEDSYGRVIAYVKEQETAYRLNDKDITGINLYKLYFTTK